MSGHNQSLQESPKILQLAFETVYIMQKVWVLKDSNPHPNIYVDIV